jgi:hypothetical protein
MKNNDYKKRILEMLNKITDESILRRIYLIIVYITGADQ